MDVKTVLEVLKMQYDINSCIGECCADSYNLDHFKFKFFGCEPEIYSDFYNKNKDKKVSAYNVNVKNNVVTFHEKIA